MLAGAALVQGCTRPQPVEPDEQFLDLGIGSAFSYHGFIDVGETIYYPTRHVMSTAEAPLRVTGLTIEGTGDATVVTQIRAVPLEAEGPRSPDNIVLGRNTFPWADGLMALDPAGVLVEPGGNLALMVVFQATGPGQYRLDGWVLTYVIDGKEYRLEIPDSSGVVAVPDKGQCVGLTPFEDEC